MQAMGATPVQIEEHLARFTPDELCPVLPEHWKALGWFLEIDDLFRYESSVCLGLDIPAVKAEAEMSGRHICKRQFTIVRRLGRLCASFLNEKLPQRRSND